MEQEDLILTRILAIASGAVLLTFLIGTFLISTFRAPSDKLAACLQGQVAGGDIGGPFTLVSETGETVTDADVITGPTLVYFGYTFCPDYCPTDNARNAAAIDLAQEAGHSIDALFITIDPARDTPEFLASFTEAFHPNLLGLTGTEEQVEAAAKAYRVFFKKRDGDDPEYYLMDHSTLTYLMMPDRGFVDFYRSDTSAEDIAASLICVAEAL